MSSAVLVVLVFGVIAVVFAAAITGVVMLAVRSSRATRARQAALIGHAYHRERDFRPEEPALVRRFRGAPFGRGGRRRALNVITGRYDGRDLVAYDYHYVTSSGEHTQRHVHAVVALHLGVRAPDLAVGPTTTLRRWVDALTGRDVPIGDPAFDQHFTVHTTSPEFARELLLSPVRDVLQHHPQLSWRIADDSLLVIRPGAGTPEQVEQLLHVMDALLDRVPEPVWDRLRGDGG